MSELSCRLLSSRHIEVKKPALKSRLFLSPVISGIDLLWFFLFIGFMNIEQYRDLCLSFPGVTEGFPFGPDVLVFKVMGKMFALTDVEKFEYINLKCDPERAVQLREQFDEVRPGYHMNKKLWNSVYTTGILEDEFIEELIIHSYDLIVESLPKKDQEALRK